MGTNYYHRTDICEKCDRYKETHIGKSSCGWEFFFRGYLDSVPVINSFEDWKATLQAEGKIFDEYGREYTFEEFIKMVEDKKDHIPSKNHFDYCSRYSADRGYSMDNDWKDDAGHAFSNTEFS